MVRSVRIVGAGLIGTSIGLALAAKNIPVEMVDVDSRNQGLPRIWRELPNYLILS